MDDSLQDDCYLIHFHRLLHRHTRFLKPRRWLCLTQYGYFFGSFKEVVNLTPDHEEPAHPDFSLVAPFQYRCHRVKWLLVLARAHPTLVIAENLMVYLPFVARILNCYQPGPRFKPPGSTGLCLLAVYLVDSSLV